MDNNSPSPSISIKPKDSTIDSKFGVVVTTPNYLQFFSDVPSYYQFLKDPKNYKDLLLGTVNIGNLIRNSLLINPEFKQLVRDIVSDIEIPSIDTDTIVTIEGEQEVKGRKDFTGGLAVNGQNLIYDPVKKVWQFTGDLVVTGAVTMFGSLSGFTPSTVTDAVLVDGETIVKTKNSQGQWQLTAIGRGGEGGGLTSDEVNILITKALSPVNKNLETKWTQDDTKITNWDSAFKWGDHSKAGYMKSTDFDTQLKKYILKDTVEQISARHNFTDGLQIAGINIYKSQDKTIYLDANLVVSGAITMFGKNSTTFETIWKDIPFDLNTMEWTGSVWRVKGGGSGSLDTNAVNGLIYEYLNRTGEEYAKQSWVNQQGFAKQSALTAVDNRLSAVETFFATEDSDTLINKWSEIVAFLNATEGDTLDNILATKANQSALDAAVASLTTEIGKKWTQNDAKISNWDSAYGWGNHANAGYAAKTYVDAELAKYVKLATAQKIDAQHNFVNGLQIGGLPITKSASANNTIYLDANLVVSGAITMFGSGSTTFPTIWADIPFNPDHMSWDGSQWNVIVEGGSGSGSLDTNAVNVLISEYLTQNSYATISDISSALVGYATQSWVGDNYLSQGGGTIEGDFGALDIKRNSNSSSLIKYSNTNGVLGYLGFLGANTPYFWDNSLTPIGLIHERNVKDFVQEYALPITGGTVNGNVTLSRLYTTEGVVLTNTGDSYSGLIPNSRITSGGQDKDFWLYNTDGAINHYATSYAFNRGNALFQGSITAVGSIYLGDDSESMLVMNRDYYNRFVAAKAGGRFAWRVNGQIDDVLVLDESGYLHSPIGFIGNLTGNADSANIATRFESVNLGITDLNKYKNTGAYNFHTSVNAPNSYISNMLVLRYSPDWGSQIVFDSEKNIFVRNWRDSGGVFDTNWRTVAFTDSNVASATKLQTPRTIWGQSFDGSGDINGIMSGVSTIHFGSNQYGGPGIYRGDWYSSALSGGDVAFYFAKSVFEGSLTVGGAATPLAKFHVAGTGLVTEHFSVGANLAHANAGRAELSIVSQGDAPTDLMFGYNGTHKWSISSRSATSVVAKSIGLYNYETDAWAWVVDVNNNIAVGGVSADAKLHVHGTTILGGDTTIHGNLLTTGVITMFSQLSMKNVIDYDGLSLEQLAQIKPARFTWKDGRDTLVHAGGIADEVMQVLPEVVYRTKDDKLTMDYGSAGFFMAASLIKPVIDHEQRLQSAEKEIKDLREENKRLIEQLRAS